MNLVVGRRYRISFREPGFSIALVRTGEYLGEEEGLTVDVGHAFALDGHTHAYLLITTDLLVSALELIPVTQRAPAVNEGSQRLASGGVSSER